MKRINLATFFDYEFSSDIQIVSSLLYANRRSDQIVTPRRFKPVDVAADFIYNPTGQALTLKRRRNIEIPNPAFYQQTDTIQGTVSVNGTIKNHWIWQGTYSWGRNTGTDGWRYDFDDERVAQTLNAALCSTSVNATLPCGDYFGVGELSDQVIDYVTYRREGTGGNQIHALSIDLSGDLIELPAGPLAFATGAVYRKEKGWRNPDIIAMQNGEEDAISGSTDVKEAFIELSVPILKEVSMADSMSVDLALRYSDYAHFDAKTTYKLGVTWHINEQMMLRSVRSSAFRTPTITEQFGGTNVENLITIDPCENATGHILNNCLAAGMPSDFIQDGSTIRTGGGGNPFIGPETAHTFTFGFVYQGEALSATLDYFDIEVDNAIKSIAGSHMLRLCYRDPVAYAAYCNSFMRDPRTRQITFLEKRPMNAASEHVSGLDVNVRVGGNIEQYTYRINWDTTRLLKHENTAFVGAEKTQLLGKITSDRGSFTKWKSNLTATVLVSNWQAAYSMQYIGKAEDENGGGPIGSNVSNVFYHDVQASYSFDNSLTLSIGIDNLFDKRPPFLTSWNDANTDVFTYDTVGRRGYLKLNYTY
nr:TonB-dependent receptor [Pseudoalteromonas sp. SMS1]